MFNEVRDACMALIVIAVTVIVLIALAKAGSGIQPRQNLIYPSGDKRGHGKTPLFMAGMKCLPLCNVPLLSAANNCLRPMQRYIN